jgi:hypothetical protein
MTLELPDRAAQHFIDELLLPEWTPSNAVGFDVNVAPESDAFLPVATSLSNVGAGYPSLVIQYSNETTGGESTYDFLTPEGPGQNRQGTLLAIARAEAEQGGFAGSATATPQPARDLVVQIIEEVERIAITNATGGSSEFRTLGSQRGPEAPDDMDVSPPVRLANCQIDYSYSRNPL